MSKVEDVPALIRRLIEARSEVSASDIAVRAGVTRQAVHHHLRPMVDAGELEAFGRGPSTKYRRAAEAVWTYSTQGLDEDTVWRAVAGTLAARAVPDNVRAILQFAVTEMVNNALDHADGANVRVTMTRRAGAITIDISDDGVGAVYRLRSILKLEDDYAAIEELSKGKVTTQPDRHTGEGVFFTSKAVNRFALESNGLRWDVDNDRRDEAVAGVSTSPGTRIRVEVSETSDRELHQIFEAYTDPETFAFSRTRTVVRLFERGPRFVSRSEAKRLARGLERFEEVLVDFAGVQEVGQGFVDELFRVWAGAHSETRLRPVNMARTVHMMVRRGLPGKR